MQCKIHHYKETFVRKWMEIRPHVHGTNVGFDPFSFLIIV